MSVRRDQCDIHFSNVVRAKAGWKCECCGKEFGGPSSGLHCAHIYGRANKAVRWSLDNAISACYSCHMRFTANPLEFHSFLLDYLGQGHLDILLEKRRQILKTNKELRREISNHYREEYKKLDNDPDYQPVSWN